MAIPRGCIINCVILTLCGDPVGFALIRDNPNSSHVDGFCFIRYMKVERQRRNTRVKVG